MSAADSDVDYSAARLGHLVILGIWRSSVQWWTFRTLVITLVIGQAVTPLLGMFVWSAALPGNQKVITYYVVLLAVQLMTVSYEDHTLANCIYDGNLAGELTKPQPVVIDFLATNVAIRIWHILFGLPLILIVGVLADASLTVEGFVLAIPAVLLGGATRFAFTYALATSAIWTQRAASIVGMGEILIFLMGGTAAPLSFLPDPLEDVGQLLPFWSMLGAPAEIAAGNIGGSEVAGVLGLQILWLIVFCGIATVVWRLGVRRYTAFGA